jgi:molybdopterin converting factor small subunit
MGAVTCRFLGSLRQVTGDQREEKVEMEGGELTLGELLRKLEGRHGQAFTKRVVAEGGLLSPSVLVSISGKTEHTARRLDAILHDGDEVTFLNALAGGQS